MTAEKKIPQRQCIACREMKNKKELIRIVKTPNGAILLDFTSKMNGRGAYICRAESCVKKCVKSRLINKMFKCEIDKAVYDKILEDFESAKG